MDSKKSIIISWIFIILLSTMSAMAIQPHINADNQQIIIINDMWLTTQPITEHEFILSEPAPIKRDYTVQATLNNNSFNEWSVEDKELLTLMMAVTVNPSYSDKAFIEIIDDAPDYVLETYIDLLEQAGY